MEQFAAFGLAPDRESTLEPDYIDIWPENAKAVEVFIALSTQWNIAMSGAVGLRYEVIPAVMRLCAVAPAERSHVFAQLRVMEAAALKELHRG